MNESIVESETVVSILEDEEIANKIKLFASGYNNANIRVFTQEAVSAIRDRVYLQGIDQSDKEEDIGRMLCENITDAVNGVCEELFLVLESNFNLESLNRECIGFRAGNEAEIIEAENNANRILITPDPTDMHFRVELRTSKFVELNTDILSQAQIDKGIKDIKEEEMQDYLEEKLVFKRFTKAKNESVEILRQLRAAQEKLTALEIMTRCFMNALQQIGHKAKSAIVKHPMIKQQLQQVATIKSTKDQIANPYDLNHLPGMYAILNERYQKKTFISFTNALINSMDYSLSEYDTDNNVLKSTRYLQKLYATWEKKKMFEQLTKDQLFSALLIKSLHEKSQIRKEVVSEVTKFIRLLEHEKERNEDSSTEVMPIFKFTIQYLEHEHENKHFGVKDNQVKGKSKDNRAPMQYNNKNYTQKQTITENAAAAAVDTTVYNTEVPRSRNIAVSDERGKNHSYIAMKSKSGICAKCYNTDDTQKTTSTCVRPCFAAKCLRCNYYGHKANTCKQSISAEGNAIKA
jgi:hypothetical protein